MFCNLYILLNNINNCVLRNMNKLKKELINEKVTIDFIKQIAGPIALNVIKSFDQKPLSPEALSKKLDTKITNVRSALNSLHYRGIACYRKEKGTNNLFNFTWEIKYKKILEILLIKEMKKFKQIENSINLKADYDLFYCPNYCIEVPFEIAAAYKFKCPNCNSKLQMIDKIKKIANLKRQKTKIKKNIEKLEKIMNKIKDNVKGYECE